MVDDSSKNSPQTHKCARCQRRQTYWEGGATALFISAPFFLLSGILQTVFGYAWWTWIPGVLGAPFAILSAVALFFIWRIDRQNHHELQEVREKYEP